MGRRTLQNEIPKAREQWGPSVACVGGVELKETQ